MSTHNIKTITELFHIYIFTLSLSNLECIFYFSTSQFGLATLQVLYSHIRLKE